MKEYRLVGLLFLLINSRVIIEMSQVKKNLKLTARQLWEFVLPGAATGVGVVPIGPGIVPVQDGYGACFCNPGTKLIE